MIRIVAQYTVRPGTESEVEATVRTFVRAVHKHEPTTDYRAFRLSNSRNFLHVMCFDDEDSHQVHRAGPSTLKHVEDLYPRCEKEPTFTPLSAIA